MKRLIMVIALVSLALSIFLIVVTANTFALVKRPNAWVIRYHNNQLIKLLYWPTINGTLVQPQDSVVLHFS